MRFLPILLLGVLCLLLSLLGLGFWLGLAWLIKFFTDLSERDLPQKERAKNK